MPEDGKPNAPIEIVIRVDPAATISAVKRGAGAAWRAARSRRAILCYWMAAAAAAVSIVVVLAMERIISGRIIGGALAVATFAGLAALKRRYSPLIRD